MICKTCSTEIPEGSEICPNCNPITKTTPQKTFWNTGKASGIGVLISILLSICLFFTSFITIFISNIQSTINASNITEIVESFLEESSFTEILESTGFKNEIVRIEDILEEEYGAQVPPQTMEKVLNNASVKNFFAKKVGEFIADCFKKDYAELVLNGEHVYYLIIENQEVLHKEINMTLTKNQIRNAVDKTIGEKNHVIMTSTTIKGDPSTNTPSKFLPPILVESIDLVKICLSPTLIIAFLLISLLIIFILIKIHLPNGITASAVSLIIVSILYIIIGTVMIPVIVSLLGDFEGSSIAISLLKNLFKTSTIVSTILIIISISALILKGIKFKRIKTQ